MNVNFNSVPNFNSGGSPGGKGNKPINNGEIKTAIDSSSGPGSDEKTTEDTEQTQAGKKATGKEDANQATTVTTDSANKKAVDKTVSKGIDIGKVLQDTKETEQAWVKTGAETDKPLPTLLESIPGYPAIPRPNRNRILDNFDELQKAFNIQEPSNLIGNPADPKEAASQMAQLSGQSLLGPGSGAISHLGGVLGERGPGRIQINNFASANSGSVSGGSVTEVTTPTILMKERPAASEIVTNSSSEIAGDGEKNFASI